jgi:DNA-binding CsgD family transcriptional regulator
VVGIRRSAYVRLVVRLQSADLRAVLDFVADVDDLGFLEPYPCEVVARVQTLVRCEDISYQDCDPTLRRFFVLVGASNDEDDEDDGYWDAGSCPIAEHRARTGDLSAVRMSDLVSRRRYHELPIFRDYFVPAGLDHVIDLGLPATAPRQRSFVLFRETSSGDFSERDLEVLQTLGPHLLRLEAHATLRRRLAEALQARAGDTEPAPRAELTPREREIVELVAEGKTNGQIAALLWVAPSTVKKHLENTYAKLGVGGRTAAATRLLSVR